MIEFICNAMEALIFFALYLYSHLGFDLHKHQYYAMEESHFLHYQNRKSWSRCRIRIPCFWMQPFFMQAMKWEENTVCRHLNMTLVYTWHRPDMPLRWFIACFLTIPIHTAHTSEQHSGGLNCIPKDLNGSVKTSVSIRHLWAEIIWSRDGTVA